jgi:hypothetical protein
VEIYFDIFLVSELHGIQCSATLGLENYLCSHWRQDGWDPESVWVQWRRKIACFSRGSNGYSFVVQFIVGRYTNWAVPDIWFLTKWLLATAFQCVASFPETLILTLLVASCCLLCYMTLCQHDRYFKYKPNWRYYSHMLYSVIAICLGRHLEPTSSSLIEYVWSFEKS